MNLPKRHAGLLLADMVQNLPSGGSMLVAIWLKAHGDHLAQSSWRSEPQVDQYSRRCTANGRNSGGTSVFRFDAITGAEVEELIDGLGPSNTGMLFVSEGCRHLAGPGGASGCFVPVPAQGVGDVTPPELTVELIDESTGLPYVPGTPTLGPVIVKFTCSDEVQGSGIFAPRRLDTSSAPGGNTYPAMVRVTTTKSLALAPRWRCMDAAGNEAPVPSGFPLSVVIDRRAPSCSIALSVRSVPRNGTPTLVTATVNGADNLPGALVKEIISISPAPEAGGPALPDVSPGTWTLKGALGKVFTFKARVTDVAGNVKECTAKVTSSGR